MSGTKRVELTREREKEGKAEMGYLSRKLEESSGETDERGGAEVLRMMPGEFVRAYEELASRALVTLSSRDYTQALEQGGGQKGKGNAGRRHGQHSEAKGGGKRYTLSKDSIRDERFFEVKQRVDRRLKALVMDEVRKLARERANELDEASRAACRGCGKFIGPGWRHCAWCGGGL